MNDDRRRESRWQAETAGVANETGAAEGADSAKRESWLGDLDSKNQKKSPVKSII
jgi:hypothetical protein